MATIHQLAANIANAQASTGPRTDAGKQIVARNAIRHGMFTCFDRLHHDDQVFVQTAYDHFRALYPQQDADLWVRELAFAWFRRDRARALCAPLYAHDSEESIKALDRFHRWDRQFTRDIDKTLKLLNSLPKPEPEPAPEPARQQTDKTNPIPPPAAPTQSLNSPCRCGSGLKYKRCCALIDRRLAAKQTGSGASAVK